MKTNEIKSLIQKRIQLRKAKKYKEADKIRDIIFNGTWKCERKYKRKWWKFWIWQHELKDLNKVKKRILKFNATC